METGRPSSPISDPYLLSRSSIGWDWIGSLVASRNAASVASNCCSAVGALGWVVAEATATFGWVVGAMAMLPLGWVVASANPCVSNVGVLVTNGVVPLGATAIVGSALTGSTNCLLMYR